VRSYAASVVSLAPQAGAKRLGRRAQARTRRGPCTSGLRSRRHACPGSGVDRNSDPSRRSRRRSGTAPFASPSSSDLGHEDASGCLNEAAVRRHASRIPFWTCGVPANGRRLTKPGAAREATRRPGRRSGRSSRGRRPRRWPSLRRRCALESPQRQGAGGPRVSQAERGHVGGLVKGGGRAVNGLSLDRSLDSPGGRDARSIRRPGEGLAFRAWASDLASYATHWS
jgi:hypothetical protein